tara:strand:- start:114 stop:515 length:402 start_codon:yes stop_codon:yes gene_type:complete
MKGPFRFALGVVGVGIEIVVVIILLILVVGLLIEGRMSTRDQLLEYDVALEEMKNSLMVVATVMQKLPEMVPQFQINENPLSQILQFFQERAAARDESMPSLADAPLREDNGQFSNGDDKKRKGGRKGSSGSQ